MLQTLGYEPDVVNNGQEALEQLKDRTYDLILMDCQMPVIDGYRATQLIRQQEEDRRHTTIVGLTAHAMAGDRQKCLDAGMDDYLAKPIDINGLVNILQKWLEMPDN
ncbi:response regulator [Pleurocapsales cyanobacterium LEGE 10410]|nr:response regulator [Pleurocapsales cyanobacterium LEGE 10410]